MEARYAMDLVCGVHGKRHPIKALATHNTAKALWMIGLAGGAKDPIENRRQTLAALFQRVQVARLAEGLA